MIRIIIILGIFVNYLAYEDFYSTIFFLGIYLLSKLTSNFLVKTERNTERELALWICSSIYLLSGIVELLIINFGTELTVGPDASRLFRFASDPTWNLRSFVYENIPGYSITKSAGFKEDFLPILVWNKCYSFFNFFSFPPGRYIGVAINTIFIVWTSFIGLSILRSINELNNKKTEDFYKILFCANGILWMYGALHLREALILFIISLLLKVWIDWINKKSFFNLIKLGIISITYYLSADYVRGGYSIILGAFVLSFVIVNIYQSISEKKITIIQLLTVPIIIGLIIFNSDFLKNAFFYFVERFEAYNQISAESSDYGSIGIVLLKQPFLIRCLFSIFYLLFMPIPIWSIIENNTLSIYHVFKSSFAIYNYLTIPFLIIIIRESVQYFKRIDQTKLFLISLYILTTLAIGITSLETRHYGNFSLIFIILISYFNWDFNLYKAEYRKILSYLFLFLFILYFVYVFLKFKSIFLISIFVAIPLIIVFYLNKENSKIR